MKNKKMVIILTSVIILIGGIFLIYNIYQNKNKVNKTKRKRQNNLAIMIKDDGAIEYTKSSSRDIPKGNYTLNREKSYCKNNGVIGDYDNDLGKISFSFIGTDSCYLYFDFHKIELYETIENRYNEDQTYLGLYTGEGADTYANPVYYYKGNVQNNNVLFGGFCWKIVRTTETGGVKIVYNGVQKNGSCNNTGTDSQIGTSAFNSDFYYSPISVGYMFSSASYYFSLSSKSMASESNIVFGNSFTYENNTYTLSDTKTVASWSSGYNTIANNHYTCMTTGTTCSTVYYVYYTDDTTAYYVTLPNGEDIEYALNEMFNSNGNDSTVKKYIDNWYENNLINYEDKLEDTVFCNDRTISNLGGWDPNGGSTSQDLEFSILQIDNSENNQNLVCPNETDRFSMSNSMAKLKHPIGLLSAPELSLSNYVSEHYFNSGEYVWLGTPNSFMKLSNYSFALVNNVADFSYNFGAISHGVGDARGVRPSVSLKPNIKYVAGNGSFTNPFVIE